MRQNIASLSLLVYAFALALLQGCSPDAQHPRGWVPLDLLPHGVPTIILAPPDAVVKAGSIQSSMVKDLTITGGKDYSIQLFYSPTLTNDILRLKNEQLQNVRANRYFRKVTKEDSAGFLYQFNVEGTESYGFRYVKLQGDLELVFQTGLGGIFSAEDAQLMYEAVSER